MRSLFFALASAALFSCATSLPDLPVDAGDVEPDTVSRPDSRIRSDVLAEMVADPSVDPFEFRVRVSGGRVVLFGETASKSSSDRVAEAAWRIRGVKEVDNRVHVLTREETERGYSEPAPHADVPPDEAIRRTVLDRIMGNPESWVFQPKVSFKDGVVTLAGIASDLRSKLSAEEAAQEIPGVRKVINKIRLQKTTRAMSDSKLQREIVTALSLDPYFNPDEIQVQVRSGIVRISGRAQNGVEAKKVFDAIASVRGVQRIENHMALR